MRLCDTFFFSAAVVAVIYFLIAIPVRIYIRGGGYIAFTRLSYEVFNWTFFFLFIAYETAVKAPAGKRTNDGVIGGGGGVSEDDPMNGLLPINWSIHPY